eukprot:m.148892 g.148892  ORF g.148892 m.148892 type:complete len:209 (+) comp15063_c4_seq4:2681-3307(+)
MQTQVNMADDSLAAEKPSVISLNVYAGNQIVSPNQGALVFLTMQLGSEKYNTDAQKKPNPQWGEACKFTIKHTLHLLSSRPNDTVLISLKEQNGSTFGLITIPVAKLGPEPKKQWGAFVASDGGPSPGKLNFECWVSEYVSCAKAKRGSLFETLTTPRKHKKSFSLDGSANSTAMFRDMAGAAGAGASEAGGMGTWWVWGWQCTCECV